MNNVVRIAALVAVITVAVPAVAQVYKPAQVAYLKAEIKRAQERFVEQAAAISGVTPGRIREWVPTDGRDVPPKVSVIPALERARGKPFTEDERKQLVAADQERFDAIDQAKREALER